MDNKNIKIGIAFIVIAFLVYIITTTIRQNKLDNKIAKLELEQKTIIKTRDSLIIINNVIDSLNKQDEKDVNKIKKNITKIDTIVNNSSVYDLQRLLYKSLYK